MKKGWIVTGLICILVFCIIYINYPQYKTEDITYTEGTCMDVFWSAQPRGRFIELDNGFIVAFYSPDLRRELESCIGKEIQIGYTYQTSHFRPYDSPLAVYIREGDNLIVTVEQINRSNRIAYVVCPLLAFLCCLPLYFHSILRLTEKLWKKRERLFFKSTVAKAEKCFFPFAAWQIPYMEAWLKRQAQKGRKLIAYAHGTFLFVKGKEKERAYCIYKSPWLKNRDAVLDEFTRMKDTYGDASSDLNKFDAPIIEIDPQKADDMYRSFAKQRNRCYQKHQIQLLMVKAVVCAIFSCATFFARALLPFVFVSLASMLYSAICLIVLKKQRTM